MDVGRYLDRIGYRGSREPSMETLRLLHRSHLFSVPFENLDIPLGRRIELDLERIYYKIVREHRGGFCHELNGLFGWLLGELGIEVTRLSARVFQEGEPGLEFGHQILKVRLDQEWLADVGFGDSFLEPMALEDSGPVEKPNGAFRLSRRSDEITMERRTPDGEWVNRYVFTTQPRSYQDFAEACHYQQTSPESHFTQGWLCSRATPEGRVTVSNGRLTVTNGEDRSETEIDGPEACGRMLAKHTGVRLTSEELEKLWEARNA